MTSTISQAGRSATDIVPVVVVVCDMEMASVLDSIVVTVSNKRSFPVIMEVGV